MCDCMTYNLLISHMTHFISIKFSGVLKPYSVLKHYMLVIQFNFYMICFYFGNIAFLFGLKLSLKPSKCCNDVKESLNRF